MYKLTAVIITKNEEKNIVNCLASLKGLCDEIIVVDDLSVDATVEICKRFGAQVISHESKMNFDKQRNLGIECASGDWILQMDADEIVPEDTAHKIKETLREPKDFVAFKLRRKNYILNYPLKHINYGYMIKIFKKGKAVYIGNSVHETLRVDGPIGCIDSSEVYHYPFNSVREVIEKWNLYTDREADLFLKGVNKIDFKEIRYRLTWKSVKLFWKLYIRKKGYRDGRYGLVWCVLNVIGPQIRWLKIWEKAVKDGKLK
ncbi:MAG: glycosyltransferase family 2 protein [Candidatus Omnitrophota bacterium]|jgi:glycosyltransferase involved in cell wall biosynthesis